MLPSRIQELLLFLYRGHTVDLCLTSGVDVGEGREVEVVDGGRGTGTGGTEWDRIPTPPAALALAPEKGT